MTKKLKFSLIATLTALLAVCVAMLFPMQKTANAEEAKGVACPGFEFKSTADINPEGFENDQYKLKFELNVTNAKHVDLLKYNTWTNDNKMISMYSAGFLTGEYGKKAKDYFEYKYTIYRDNGDGKTAVPTDEIIVVYDYAFGEKDVSLSREVYYKALRNDNEKVNVFLSGDYDYKFSDGTIETINKNGISGKYAGYTLIEGGTLSMAPYSTVIEIEAQSPYTQFYVEFEYNYYLEKQYNMWLFEGYKVESYTYTDACRSNRSSAKNVLLEADSAGTLEDLLTGENLTKAQEIIGSTVVKRVKIKYLEQIGSTPFAKHVYKNVDVPVVQDKINVQDVASFLGLTTFDCLGSLCEEFRWSDAEDCYVAYYYVDTWIEAQTTDEHSEKYFLDINKSFYETYYGYVEAGIFSEQLYEFVWKEVLKAHSDVRGLEAGSVYGLFGLVVMPEAYTVQTMYEKIFGESGTFESENITSFFVTTETISKDSYNKLLDEYDYSWLERLWGDVFVQAEVVEAKATYFLFMADPGSTYGKVGEGDQDDVPPLKEMIGNWFENLKEVFNGSGGSCSGGLSFGTILLIAGVFAVVIFLRKRK